MRIVVRFAKIFIMGGPRGDRGPGGAGLTTAPAKDLAYLDVLLVLKNPRLRLSIPEQLNLVALRRLRTAAT